MHVYEKASSTISRGIRSLKEASIMYTISCHFQKKVMFKTMNSKELLSTYNLT